MKNMASAKISAREGGSGGENQTAASIKQQACESVPNGRMVAAACSGVINKVKRINNGARSMKNEIEIKA